ncbi:TrkA C-terminal domain-containing protein [Anaerosinus gibii]|uniref:TrkA C-terminal domain-containing protein n=1 Tax=Selenobaculum gibii TaxID=3054208 RepID=A0A9Y2AJX3_9FIRM|nr:TrkA C-terminal domain-containing protein [Selenobaculum gbiensis]WIW71272.1 TrkA C-terminal domain-containing protein [Selenobaculum gbiensis]
MSLPIYQSIAIDIARRIVNKEFSIGDKISGRTLLSAHYGVSSETIRKAIAILKEVNVLSVSQGKEVEVISQKQAFLFLTNQKEVELTYSLKQELEMLLKEKEKIDLRFRKVTSDIINYSDRLKNINPYNPFEIQLTSNCSIVGKSLKSINFRQNTGSLIIAIRREKEVYIAPDPNELLKTGDRLVIVGSQESLQAVNDFIYS